jgi:multiple sugar transport system permease protein
VLSMLQYLWTLFGSAGLILLLTRGGPGEATSTLSWLVYWFGFRQSQVGYSQMIGLVLFALGIVGLVVIRRVFRARY